MANTVTFEFTENQARSFEKTLDATLAILNRMEKESPEREARFDKNHEDFLRNISETDKSMKQTSLRLAKWQPAMEK